MVLFGEKENIFCLLEIRIFCTQVCLIISDTVLSFPMEIQVILRLSSPLGTVCLYRYALGCSVNVNSIHKKAKML
jgi:hypothetical protein